jgi:hypothetical protein
MHGDGAYYEVVDVDSSQFIGKLSAKWKKLEVCYGRGERRKKEKSKTKLFSFHFQAVGGT